MGDAAASLSGRRILPVATLGLSLVLLSVWIGSAPLEAPLLAVVAAVLFLATVLNAEAGLVILVLSMLLSPEFGLGGAGGSGLEGQRSVILRTEDLVLLLVGFAWIARMAIHKDLGAVRRTRLNAFIAAYAACCLLSTLLGIEAGRVRAIVGLCFVAKYVEYFIIYFITVNYVRREDQLRRLLAAVLLTAALITLYAYWQIPQGVRPSAPFEGREGEPNTLGGYLVLAFSVACGLALTATERRWKRCGALLAAASIPPILATLSRSSWMALAASLLVLLAMSPNRRRLAAAAILAGTLIFFVHPSRVEDRIVYTFQGNDPESVSVGRVRLDPSSSARLSSWSSALSGFVQHPIAGHGVTGYGFLDAQYFRILVEIGSVGFAAFALLIGTAGRLFQRTFATLDDPLHRGLGLGMTAALAGLLAHAIGTNTFMLIRIMEPFWLLCGLCVAALAIEEGS
ncbi:MAG TPA: O-antigen ligase family protein [Candidatus Polarisedimenticolia bacterium]|nr:O-antigen ligase family protein [Candidatus Polarisedimenticolia bacterium]